MVRKTGYTLLSMVLLSPVLLLTACDGDRPSSDANRPAERDVVEVDVVARVGGEVITFGQLNAMLNSTAAAGMPIPELGTPERNQAMITLLDNAISANLIYLDARKKGIDRLAAYREDVRRFEDAMLASMYKNMLMQGETRVSDLEVMHYYNTQTSREAGLDDNKRLAIEAMLRRQKLDAFEASLRERIRDNVDVVINENVLATAYDNKRSDADVVATYDSHRVTWNQVRELMKDANRIPGQATFYIDDDKERRSRLEQHLDHAIMALKGRAAGLEEDPVFVQRVAEYRKARLINEHRNALVHSWNPDESQLKAFYDSHSEMFTLPAARRVQMVTVETRDKAASLLGQITSQEISLEQAAMQHSIDPQTRHTLGHIGWLSKGMGSEAINDLIFELEPGVVSEPVESPAGWHLIKVVDSVDERLERFDDAETHQRIFQAYMQDRFNDYVVDLRRHDFEVAVYQDELDRQFRREAEFIGALEPQQDPAAATVDQQIEALQKRLASPAGQ